MGANVLSDDVGYPGVAAAFGLAAVFAAVQWLRSFPPAVPLITFASRVLLSLAFAAVITAAFTPTPWSGVATLTAAACTAAAVPIPADSQQALAMLLGACNIGLGVAAIGVGIARLRGGDTLPAIALIGLGIAFIGARLRGGDTLSEIALIGGGIPVIGFGVFPLARSGAAGCAGELACPCRSRRRPTPS